MTILNTISGWRCRTGFLGLVIGAGCVASLNAGTILFDDFSASTLNSGSPAAPTASSTAYHLFSSKSWSPAPGIGAGGLKFGIANSISGHIEAQALFSPAPVALTNAGDYLELKVTFTNRTGLFDQSGQVGFGLYNSGGVPPMAGGMNGTAVSGTTGVTGGAQGWQGYVARVVFSGGNHRIATRPSQTITTGNNQDLITEGSGSQSYVDAVSLAGSASTFIQATNAQLTDVLRFTLSASGTLQITNRLFLGGDTNGTLLVSQSATATGTNFLTNSFDALALGWRATANTNPTWMDVASITVSSSVVADGGTTTNTVAGIYFQQQPTDANAGAILSPAVTVGATNSAGAPVTNASITLSLLSGAGALNGTLTQATDNSGIATFADIALTASGAKQLRAESGSAVADSAVFLITNTFVPAFPGAEGAGAGTSGGRGGDVYYVTSLSDANTSGTLRYGINNAPAGGRTICFKVSGNIVLNSTLTITKPNLTVAGQTAPGDGICVQNYSFNISANNVIVRHLRSRLGTNAMQESDCMWLINGTNLIVDHVSASWSVDEVLSANNGVISNLTVQNCYITEALRNSIHSKGNHGYGSIISCVTNATYSYLRNLYAHNDSRNPRVGSSSVGGTLRLDFRNNVIYNYGGRAGYTGGTNESCAINYVGNYCIKGPSSTYNYILAGGGDTTQVYQNGNYIDLNKNGLVDGADTGWSMFSGAYTPTNSPFAVPAATTESAPVAYQRVVALSGAMPWRRDANDQRIARTVRQQIGAMVDFVGATNQATDYVTNNINGTNYVGVRGWPTLVSETAPTDTDSDGMPDYWETAMGMNPSLASDRNQTNSATGYTRLEEYLNWLAAAHARCDKNGSVEVSLRDATGGATNLTYTVTNGDNGTVVLLGDGYTARFTAAAGTNGLANFAFTATDPAAGTSFGPVDYGILITTNLAPVTNTAPVFAAINDRTVMAGSNISFTCSVTDTDAPPQIISFDLTGAPAGATLGANSGVFDWRPTVALGGSTNLMSIIATDNGVPPLSATQSFTVVVLPPARPAIAPPSIAGGLINLVVGGDFGPDYTIQGSTNLLNWTDLFTTNQPALPFVWTDPATMNYGLRFYRVLLGP